MHRFLRGAGPVLVAAGLVVLSAGAGPAGAEPGPSGPAPGTIYLVQALPDTEVSVEIDGEVSRTGVQESAVLGPFRLAPGEHELTVTGQDPDWSMEVSLRVRGGTTADVVVHRPASPSGRPEATIYRAPLGAISGDRGRVLLAHTATVPPADVLLDGDVAFSNIANGEFVTAAVPAGEHRAELVPTGRKGPAFLGPLALPVRPRTLTSVYAVGQPQDGSMNVIVHRLPLPTDGSAAPEVIDTGSAGLVGGRTVDAATSTAATEPTMGSGPGTGWSWIALSALALLVVAAPARQLARGSR